MQTFTLRPPVLGRVWLLSASGGVPSPTVQGRQWNPRRDSGHQRWGGHHLSAGKQLGFVGLVGLTGSMVSMALTGSEELASSMGSMELRYFVGLIGFAEHIRCVGFRGSARLIVFVGLRDLSLALVVYFLGLLGLQRFVAHVEDPGY